MINKLLPVKAFLAVSVAFVVCTGGFGLAEIMIHSLVNCLLCVAKIIEKQYHLTKYNSKHSLEHKSWRALTHLDHKYKRFCMIPNFNVFNSNCGHWKCNIRPSTKCYQQNLPERTNEKRKNMTLLFMIE